MANKEPDGSVRPLGNTFPKVSLFAAHAQQSNVHLLTGQPIEYDPICITGLHYHTIF